MFYDIVSTGLLLVGDTSTVRPPGSMSPLPPSASGRPIGDDDDYVYDVFYQRPTTFEALYEPSMSMGNIGTLCVTLVLVEGLQLS